MANSTDMSLKVLSNCCLHGHQTLPPILGNDRQSLPYLTIQPPASPPLLHPAAMGIFRPHQGYCYGLDKGCLPCVDICVLGMVVCSSGVYWEALRSLRALPSL